MENSAAEQLIGTIIFVNWKVGGILGRGSFGEIFECQNLNSGEVCAVKVESRNSKHPQLLYESKVLKYMQGDVGIANLKFSVSDANYNYMGVEKLGSSLEDIFNSHRRYFSLKTVCMLAIQMISRVEYFHSKNFVHRDLKPDNFLIGTGANANRIYLIDFGLAKRFRDPRGHQHIPYREDKSLTGTARYASINAHRGIEQSRRDDMEALAFVLMYFVRRGLLPWQGIKAEKKTEKYQIIMERKMHTSIRSLCKGAQPCFVIYLHYIRSLRFESKPDYQYLRGLFLSTLQSIQDTDDGMFDWIEKTLPSAGISTSAPQCRDNKENKHPDVPENSPPQVAPHGRCCKKKG